MAELVGGAIVAGLTAVEATGAAAAIGGSIFGGALTYSTVIGGVLLAGGLYGAEKLLAPKPRGEQPSFKMPPGPVPFETEAQAVRDRFFTCGTDRLGGTFLFRESNGSTLGYGIILNCGPIDGVVDYFVDDELLALSTGPTTQSFINSVTGVPAATTVDYGPNIKWPNVGLKFTTFYSYTYVSGPGGKGGSQTPYVIGQGPLGFLEFRNATDAGFASTLITGDFPTLWTADHKARGLAMLYSRWQAIAVTGGKEAHYPRYWPVHSTVIRGARMYDPRDTTTSFLDPVSGVYSPYNPTWSYSANNALCIAWYLTHPEGGRKRYDQINWLSFAEAANDCGDLVAAYGGGTEPFAQCHTTWGTAEQPRDVLARMYASCDGQVYEDENGKICLWIRKWIEPEVTLTLTAADISTIQIDETAGVYAETNYVQATYVEPRTNYSRNTSVVVTDDASIASVGQRRGTMDFVAVHSFSQAYRLAARALRLQNSPLKLEIVGGIRLLLAEGQRVVRIEMPDFGISGVFRINAMSADDPATVKMSLSLVTEDMFAIAVPPYDPVNPALPGVPVSVNFTPAQAVISAATGVVSAGTGHLSASAAPPTGDGASIAHFQSREVDPTSHVAIGTGDWTSWSDATGQYSGTSPDIAASAGSAKTFEIEAFFVSSSGVPGPQSISSFIDLNF